MGDEIGPLGWTSQSCRAAGRQTRNFTIATRARSHTSAQAYLARLAVPCSVQRLAADAKPPGPHLTSLSINEAPPTRRRAGRLVRVAYHAACSEMGLDGYPWMDLTLVCGAGYWWKGMLSPRPPQQASQHRQAGRCRDQICPSKTWDLSPSQQPSGFTVVGGVVICSQTSHYWYYTWPFVGRSFTLRARTMASAQALFNGARDISYSSNELQ